MQREFFHSDKVDEALVMIKDGSDYYMHADNLGSVITMSKEDKSIEEQYAYSAFGEMKIYDENGVERAASSLGNIYGYTGREMDEESDLYYYRARYYNPGSGRFLSEDPIGFESGDFNRYRYVLNNPTYYTDSSGKCPWCVAGIIAFGVDVVTQLAFNGGDFSNINWTEAAVAGAAGAAGVGLLQKIGKVSTAFKGAARPTHRFLKIKGKLRLESHPISSKAPNWLSYPHAHLDFSKNLAKRHIGIVEPTTALGSGLYNYFKDEQGGSCGP